MPYLLPALSLRDPDDGTCFELANNCRTLAYMRTLQPTQWRLSECEDCCPDCIDSGPYSRPSLDGTFWTSGNNDPAADEFLGLFIHSLWMEPARSVRRVGETLSEVQAFSPRRLELVGELITDTVRGAALAWASINEALSRCGSAGWNLDVQQFCPDEGELATVNSALLAAATFSEPTVPIETLDHDCDPCRRIDPSVWEPTPLPPEDSISDFAAAVVDSGGRQLLRARVVSIDENPDGADLLDCEGIPVKIVLEIFSDASFGDAIALPCFTNPLLDALDATGLALECADDGEAVPDGAIGFTCSDELPVIEGTGIVRASCADDLDRGLAECRPYNWADACLQVGSNDTCTSVDDDDDGQDIRAAATTVGDYCQPMWRRVASCLIPRLPSPTDGVLRLEVASGSAELANLKFELWPAFDNVEDPATCTGEFHYRGIEPCETWEISRIEANSVLTIDGQTDSVEISCLGQPPVTGTSLVTGAGGARTRHPVISPDCRWWLVATIDCDRTADDYSIAASFVPRFPN